MARPLLFILCLVWGQVSAVQGLACLLCSSVQDVSQCTSTICSPGQSCFIEETVTSQREVRYNMGCESQQVCLSLTSIMGQRHPASRDTDSAMTTCFRCCDSDFCNAGNCTFQDFCRSGPCSNGATCENAAQGFSCHCVPGWTGPRCAQDVDECLSSPCQHGGSCSNLPGSFSCACSLGYHGNLCQLKSNKTVCQKCASISNPLECNNPVVCADNEECFTDKILSQGNISYKMGCRSTDFCGFFRQHVQVGRETRQSHAITTCSDCCRQDDCNRDFCREEPNGTICLSCDKVQSAKHCHNITICDATQECYGEEEVDLATGQSAFSFGCASRQVCDSLTRTAMGRRDLSSGVTRCLECCTGHYCNRGRCTGGAAPSTTSSAITTSTTTPPSTNIPSSAAATSTTNTTTILSTTTATSTTNTIPPAAGPCDSQPCQNGGTCQAAGDAYTCRCPLPFTGLNCTQTVGLCETLPFSPCHNGGTCISTRDGFFSCRCLPGFNGHTCMQASTTVATATAATTTDSTTPPATADPYSSLICKNGGSCVSNNGTAKCACVDGCSFVEIDSIGCGGPQDVLVLLSGGRETTPSAAQHMLNFASTLVRNPRTQVDAAHTQVSVAFYDHHVHTVLPLSHDLPAIKATLQAAVSDTSHVASSPKNADLANALDEAAEVMRVQGRPSSAKVVLVIANTYHGHESDLKVAMTRLKDSCISLNLIAITHMSSKNDAGEVDGGDDDVDDGGDDASVDDGGSDNVDSDGGDVDVNNGGGDDDVSDGSDDAVVDDAVDVAVVLEDSDKPVEGMSVSEYRALSHALAVYGDAASHKRLLPSTALLDSASWNTYFESGVPCSTPSPAP